MSAIDKKLDKPGNFLLHRDLSGAAAADSATLSDANFPISGVFRGDDCDSIWVTWSGTGGAGTDTITVRPLIRDAARATPAWTQGDAVTIERDGVKEIPIRGAGQVFIRISAVSTTATDLEVRVAKAQHERPQ